MNIYRATNPCPKCAKIETPVAYDPATNIMRRTCDRCSYGWDEEPCDTDAGARVVEMAPANYVRLATKNG